jgi:chromosome segregation ATPase
MNLTSLYTHRAIYKAAAEICNKEIDPSESDYYSTIAVWTLYDPSISGDSATAILSALLCVAIDEECHGRQTYIGRIMGLDKGVQLTLMQIITDFNNEKNGVTPRRSHHHDESYLDDLDLDAEDNVSLLYEDEEDMGMGLDMDFTTHNEKENMRVGPFIVPKDIGVVRTPLSPFHSPLPSSTNIQRFSSSRTKKLSPPPSSTLTRGVGARKVIRLEKESEALAEKNAELNRELELIRRQENSMRVRCEEMEAINRAARLKLESEALVQISEMRDEFSTRVSCLERELEKKKDVAKEASIAKEQLAGLQDEVDILQHSKIKLQQTENQLQKMKIKLEQMGDASKALENEERAHSDAVSKCLDLENELAALGPLKRQLEEYKGRATDAEVKLVDCEDEIKRLREAGDNMNGFNNELQRGNRLHQAEAEELRKTLEHNESETTDGHAVGGGMSELNPKLKEELLRLRSENARLKTFAAKRGHDSVQRLEEACDDAKRLAEKFKEQYLATKNTLESTQRDLFASIHRENDLQKRIVEVEGLMKDLEKTLHEERIAAQKAKLDATKLLHSTKKEMGEQSKAAKEQLVQEWQDKLEEERASFEEKYALLSAESTESAENLQERIAELRQQSVASLHKMEQEFKKKSNEMEKEHEDEIDNLKLKSEEEMAKLMNHGKQLIQKKQQKILAMEETVTELNTGREQLLEAQKEFEKKVATKIQSYKQRLTLSEVRAEEIAKECDDIQTKCMKLERERANLQSENDRFRRQLGGRFGTDKGQYEDLQRNYNDLVEENRSLKEKASNCTQTAEPSHAFNLSRPYSAGASVSASSLSQLRSEYEDKIEEINDDKRELVMKNSALITDEKKAQKRAWEFEVEIKKLENVNTSLQLQLERIGNNGENNMQSPVAMDKRGSSKLTPASLKSKASKMWKASKLSRKAKYSKDSPGSVEPMIELKSPEFNNSLRKLDVDGFKSKLAERLSSKKSKDSPIKSMSLMDLAASKGDLEVDQWEISFSK